MQKQSHDLAGAFRFGRTMQVEIAPIARRDSLPNGEVGKMNGRILIQLEVSEASSKSDKSKKYSDH